MKRSLLHNQKGQGLIEYLIIVALVAVATIGVVRVMSQNIAAKFAEVTYAIQGRAKAVQKEEVRESLYKKKDLGNFFNGAGNRSGETDSE